MARRSGRDLSLRPAPVRVGRHLLAVCLLAAHKRGVRHGQHGIHHRVEALKGFRRITVQPNETKTVTLPVKAEDLAYWDETQNKWIVEADQVKFTVGASSAAAKLERTIGVGQ